MKVQNSPNKIDCSDATAAALELLSLREDIDELRHRVGCLEALVERLMREMATERHRWKGQATGDRRRDRAYHALEEGLDELKERVRFVAADQPNSAYCNATFAVLTHLVRIILPDPAQQHELFFMVESGANELQESEGSDDS